MSQDRAFNTERVLTNEAKERLVGIQDGRIYNVVTANADTDVAVPHDLGRVPRGYLVVSSDKGGVVYTGSVAPSSTVLTIRNTVAIVNLRLLIW